MPTAPMLLVAAALLAPAAPPDPHDDFAFWVGEWSVLNRHVTADGTWRDGDTTRARITPFCDGRAILEEWAGPFGGATMHGFSLRAYDPDARRWRLLLSWTTDGETTFGTLSGAFRHGRGEFFTNTRGPNRTRYTFSDTLPDTVRWDSAKTTDAGLTWATDWIMEFTRTREAREVTPDAFFGDVPWTTGELSPHVEARALDGLLGAWSGEQRRADGVTLEARLEAKLVNADCLVVDLLEVRPDDAASWDGRLCVRGFVPARERWESWRVSARDTVLRPFVGADVAPDDAVFEHAGPSGETVRETLVLDGDRLTIREEAVLADGSLVPLATTTLTRMR